MRGRRKGKIKVNEEKMVNVKPKYCRSCQPYKTKEEKS